MFLRSTIFTMLLACMGLSGEAMVQNRSVYFVVLAGGSGERLWPVSRRSLPKQLLTIDDSEKTLLERALDRVRPLAADDSFLWVLTTTNHERAVSDRLGRHVGQVLVEPVARNTGPAIVDCCMRIAKIDPEALVVFLPADAFIPLEENSRFIKTIEDAVSFTHSNDSIALIGVKPHFASTGYGYIEYDKTNQDPGTQLYKVEQFHEKPNHDRAVAYLENSSMLWNIGMFCGKVSVLVEEFKTTCPDLYQAVNSYQNAQLDYDSVPSISIDYAVIERSKRIWVKPADFKWCDVGNLSIFLDLKRQYVGLNQNVITVDSANNLVDVPDKLVALVGVNDLCIVQTSDALLITKRDEAEKVRSVVNQLKQDQSIEYL